MSSLRTAFPDLSAPNDMPIWARLALPAKGLRFAEVEAWRLEDEATASVFTVYGGWHVLNRRTPA